MARLLTAGNELGDYGADGFSVWVGTDSDTWNQYTGASSPGRSRGYWSFYLTNGNGLEYDFSPDRPGGINEFYLRLHMLLGNRSDGNWERLRFTTADGTQLLRFGTTDGGGGSIPGGFANYGFFDPTGSLSPFVSSSTSIRNSFWNLVEMYIRFDGSDGEIKLWVNGNQTIQYNGSLTGPGAETQMYLLRLHYDQISGGAAGSTYYDNIALNDTTGSVNSGRVGNGFVLPLTPVAEGSSSQLTNAFGTSTDNFKFINKRVAWNPSGFVGTNTPDDKDLYGVSQIQREFHGVNAVKLGSYGVRNGPSITKAKFIVKPAAQAEIDLPAGVGVGVDLPIGTPDYFWQEFETNPNTSGEPFQYDELDGGEVGVQFIA